MKTNFVAIAISFFAIVAVAQNPAETQDNCRKLEKIETCRVADVFGGFVNGGTIEDVDTMRLLVRLPRALPEAGTASEAATTTRVTEAVQQAARGAGNRVENDVKSENVATTPPPSSDARVHASRQNFNVPLSAAVTSIDRTKNQALVVKFNRANAGPFSFGTTLTVAQPALSKDIEKAIKESKRAVIAKNLASMLEDTDDISLSFSFTPRTPHCHPDELLSGSCYGRAFAGYRDVLGPTLGKLLILAGGTSATTDRVVENARDFIATLPRKGETPFGDLSTDQRGLLFDFIAATKRGDAADTQREIAARKKLKTANVAKLINNQPQWTLSVTGQRRDALVGANKFAADLEFERGIVNLNSLMSRCKDKVTDCLAKALLQENRLANHSFVFRVGVKQSDSYGFAALPAGVSENPEADDFTGITTPRIRTYRGEIQYGFDVESVSVSGTPTHLDFNGSWSQTTGDPKQKHTRTVISTTLTIPLAKEISLPVTLSYANRPEFLEDEQKSLGIHFGLTYRLPFKKPE